MKRRLGILAALLLAALLLCACGNNTPAPAEEVTRAIPEGSFDETPWLESYAPALESYADVLADEDEDLPITAAPVSELCRYFYDGRATETVGFCLEDLDGNGVPELIIAPREQEREGDRMLLAVFTLNDRELVPVLQSEDKNRFYLWEDNTIFNEVFDRSDESGWLIWRLNGAELEQTECLMRRGEDWFLDTGEGEQSIAEDDALERANEYRLRNIQLQLTPFADYGG